MGGHGGPGGAWGGVRGLKVGCGEAGRGTGPEAAALCGDWGGLGLRPEGLGGLRGVWGVPADSRGPVGVVRPRWERRERRG